MTQEDETEQEMVQSLRELDSSMSECIEMMDKWEKKLRSKIQEGDREAVMEEMPKGHHFELRATEAKDSLATQKCLRKDGPAMDPSADGTGAELDGLETAIEEKCALVTDRVQKLLEDVLDSYSDLGDKLKESMDQIKDMEIYFDLDD